jgi:oligopeptidase A
MTNPLLDHTLLPLFSKLKPEHVEPAIDQLLADARAAIDQHLQATSAYTWENLIEPIDNANDTLDKAWSPVSHINSVLNSDELRAAYNACLPKLSQYGTEIGQNTALFNAYRTIADSTGFKALDIAQQKTISNALRDFKLSGVDLDADKKQRYQDICQALSKLASSYEENLMDASNAWTKLIADTGQLAGLPESALAQALQAAKQEDKTGWLLTLQFPSYYAVMTYADNRDLRQEVYTAYCTRASDQAQSAAQWDNSAIMAQILALRHDKAQLLGFNNFAELSLATKMADTADEVIGFLEDLAVKSKPQALADLAELRAYAKQHYGMDDLQPWDMGYYSEKMREYLYEFSEEQVKAYFPITRVLPGLFAIVNKLYGLQITEITEFDSWHPDVQFFQIHDKTGQLRGQFYIDLYARPKKRGGAWMDDCVNRKKTSQGIQTPVAYLTCNFSSPTGNDPALLTHDEVITLFHEFGHGLHHMLTQVDYLGVSGIHGVEWDAVELPSQFMENWCWENEALALISGHYQTGEPLPKDLFDKMTAAKNFQAGMIMVRQLEFSLFDFKIHLNYDPAQGGRIYEILEQVRNQVSVVKAPAFNRFAHGFSHIFAGGYAAGYYSYKWAEVLSSDAFSLFEEQGIFNPEVGNAFLTNVLEKGGSQNAMELFTQY